MKAERSMYDQANLNPGPSIHTHGEDRDFMPNREELGFKPIYKRTTQPGMIYEHIRHAHTMAHVDHHHARLRWYALRVRNNRWASWLCWFCLLPFGAAGGEEGLRMRLDRSPTGPVPPGHATLGNNELMGISNRKLVVSMSSFTGRGHRSPILMSTCGGQGTFRGTRPFP